MIDPNNLPEGWTVCETRFLWALCKDGQKRSFGLTEEAVRFSINLQPEFYEGDAKVLTVDKHVDL